MKNSMVSRLFVAAIGLAVFTSYVEKSNAAFLYFTDRATWASAADLVGTRAPIIDFNGIAPNADPFSTPSVISGVGDVSRVIDGIVFDDSLGNAAIHVVDDDFADVLIPATGFFATLGAVDGVGDQNGIIGTNTSELSASTAGGFVFRAAGADANDWEETGDVNSIWDVEALLGGAVVGAQVGDLTDVNPGEFDLDTIGANPSTFFGIVATAGDTFDQFRFSPDLGAAGFTNLGAFDNFEFVVAPVPEPSTYVLFATMIAGGCFLKLRSRKNDEVEVKNKI